MKEPTHKENVVTMVNYLESKGYIVAATNMEGLGLDIVLSINSKDLALNKDVLPKRLTSLKIGKADAGH